MRGANTLFADVFELPVQEKSRKGRSLFHIQQRNHCLIDRFVFYGRTTGFRYELLIRILSKEFFLSEDTIPDIIDNNYDLLRASKTANQTKDNLKEKWPHMHWGTPVVQLDA